MSENSDTPSSSMAELLAKRAKARSVKGKDFPLCLNHYSSSLKSLLGDLSDKFPSNAHLDGFNFESIMSAKDVKFIKKATASQACSKKLSWMD